MHYNGWKYKILCYIGFIAIIVINGCCGVCEAGAKPQHKPTTVGEDNDKGREEPKDVSNKVEYGKSTGLPVPRFVALKSRETNWRNGPGNRYPIKWVYTQRGYPVQVVAEFEGWRKVRDVDGEDGWVHEALISGQRNVVVVANSDRANDEVPTSLGQLVIYRKPDEASYPVAKLEFGVIAKIRSCQEKWCRIEVSGYTGWARKGNLWGVMPYEIIK